MIISGMTEKYNLDDLNLNKFQGFLEYVNQIEKRFLAIIVS